MAKNPGFFPVQESKANHQKSNKNSSSELSLVKSARTRGKTQSKINKKNPDLFFNRELSWLEFNNRVLKQTTLKENPLLEKLKFLAIFEANLIEFFMIRVGGLKQMKASSYSELQLDGRTPLETLQEISRIVHFQLQVMSGSLNAICQNLENVNIQLLKSYKELNPLERKFIHNYFQLELFRVLTPFAVDPGHPFPRITNARINLVAVLERKTGKSKSEETYAFIEVPSVFPRFLELPRGIKKSNTLRLIALEETIKMYLQELFVGIKIRSVSEFTIIRNSELAIDEVASDNLLSTVEDELKNRRWGEVVSLHYRQGLPKKVIQFLVQEMDIEKYEIYERPGLLNMQDFRQLYEQLAPGYSQLCDKAFLPRNILTVKDGFPHKIFQLIKQKDRLFHHPYDSFQSIEDLISIAAKDPKVLAIKQSLYRTGKDSPCVASLIEAAENGKQVTALVELKARFDEERNINWAREMENHGVHVVYGLVGLKIHGKILQIIRREQEGICSYAHLSTGNYNPATAKLYTDLGLMTADPEINHDVANLFHSLTGVAVLPRFKKIATAPINLRYTLLRLIQREIANAEKGKKARIRLKMNSLVDPEMIIALYRASQAGVSIELNIRGICCLRPGIPGISDRIQVVSVVGRFLEHSRIFYFENGGKARLFLSSADLMPRNLNRRVEILFPIEDLEHIERLVSILEISSQDNYYLSQLDSAGTYKSLPLKSNQNRFSSQRFFCEQANRELKKMSKDKQNLRRMVFQPLANPNPLKTKLNPKHSELSSK